MNETLYKKAKRLIIINDILRYIGIALTIIILLIPYLPEISYLIHNDNKKSEQTELPNEISMAIKNGIDYLYIPSIGVGESIIEAQNIGQVHERVWRRPQASNPKDGGNTVLVAHRYATIGGNRASTFYHLPKLVAGDMIYVVWDGVLYTYNVEMTETVEPTQVSIEAPTDDTRLTLYTCTPLWTASHRFVVHAIPTVGQ
jgi:sortase A